MAGAISGGIYPRVFGPAAVLGSLGELTFVTDAVDTDGAITPQIGLVAGCPYNPGWDFGDGSAIVYTTAPSHTYGATPGEKTVRLIMPDLQLWLNWIDVDSCHLVGGGTLFQGGTVKRLAALTAYRPHTNANLTGGLLTENLPGSLRVYAGNATQLTLIGECARLPSTLVHLQVNDTPSALTGPLSALPDSLDAIYIYNSSSDLSGPIGGLPPSAAVAVLVGDAPSGFTGTLSDLPATLWQLNIANTALSSITGSLSDLKAAMLECCLYSTSVRIDGGATPMVATGLRNFQVQSTSCTAADLDSILARIYADRAIFTHPFPTMNLGGTNPDPSGVYQDSVTPSTGLEYAYKLVNDPDAEGFNKWTITY
jgi:hypothetical protein